MEEAPAGKPLRAFAAAFFGAAVGAALVLWAYDHFVLQPREAAQAQQVAIDLAEARVDAEGIATDLDNSVDRSVDRARDAFSALAGDQDKARVASEAFNRGAPVRTAVSEFYVVRGAWPGSLEEAGVPAYDPATGGAVRAITMGPRGVVTILLREPFEGSRFVLTPSARNDGMLEWSCHSEGDVELRRMVPACAP